jgi:hypothetical protein
MSVKWPRHVAALATLLIMSGCGPDHALSVGEAGFPDNRLRGLPDHQIDLLIALTALGTAFAGEEVPGLVSPLVNRELEELRIDRLREAVTLEEAGVDEDQLERWYAASPEAELVVRHLVVLAERWRSAEFRDQARRRANEALRRIGEGAPFAQIAGEYSDEDGAAERGGLLAPGREGTWVREFWAAASALEPGEVSGIVETDYGFHVLRLDERRAVPFVEARDRFASTVAEGFADPEMWESRVEGWLELEPAGDRPPEEVRRGVLLAEAERRGIALAPVDSTTVEDTWARRADGWAGTLGFEPRMTPSEVADQALRALGRTDQDARLAREAISAHLDDFAKAYPVRRSIP